MRVEGVSGGSYNLRPRRIVAHPDSQSDAAREYLAEITILLKVARFEAVEPPLSYISGDQIRALLAESITAIAR